MPGKQQEIIALAIVGLIAVMVAFAIFDHVGDERRAESMTYAPAIGAIPYGGAAAANTSPWASCRACGWQGQALGGQCPRCYAVYGSAGAMMSPAPAYAVPGDTQNAGFFWNTSRAAAPAQPKQAMYCPQCDFAMSSKFRAPPNTVRCPRCVAFLEYGAGVSGRQAAFVPGYGGGYNPARPNFIQ